MNGRRLHSRRHGGWLQSAKLKSKPAKGFAALTTMALVGLTIGLVVSGGPAGADVTSVSGRAWGNSRTVGLIGNPPAIPLPPGLISFGPRPDTGPLPPNGGNLTASEPSETGLGYSTGAENVATSGGNVPGPNGFSQSSADISAVNVQGGTIVAGVLLPAPPDFSANRVQAVCRSDAFNQSATGPGGAPNVTITGGQIQNAAGTGTNPVPANPPPNTVLTGGNANEITVT
ncbi:MAG: hypothetical protein QOD57_183, partial [Actinomycetota bacterium]|nr:hypothetical protein [Actinomycetota bacterium]